MNLHDRLVGLVKAIDEEMQPGSREFALAAVDELIDAQNVLKSKYNTLEEAVRRAERAAHICRMAEVLYDTDECPGHWLRQALNTEPTLTPPTGDADA